MKLSVPGKSTSKHAEVVGITFHGIWVLVRTHEHFLPYADFPWFKNARINDVYNVKLVRGHYLQWPALDVDLAVDSLTQLDRYPLIYR